MTDAKFEQWANVELMGHQRVVGRCTEEAIAGTNMLRVDVPNAIGTFTTQYFSGGAIYRITPVSEEVARKLCAGLRQDPPFVWELREHPKTVTYGEDDDPDQI
jgi:hypothetical protein